MEIFESVSPFQEIECPSNKQKIELPIIYPSEYKKRFPEIVEACDWPRPDGALREALQLSAFTHAAPILRHRDGAKLLYNVIADELSDLLYTRKHLILAEEWAGGFDVIVFKRVFRRISLRDNGVEPVTPVPNLEMDRKRLGYYSPEVILDLVNSQLSIDDLIDLAKTNDLPQDAPLVIETTIPSEGHSLEDAERLLAEGLVELLTVSVEGQILKVLPGEVKWKREKKRFSVNENDLWGLRQFILAYPDGTGFFPIELRLVRDYTKDKDDGLLHYRLEDINVLRPLEPKHTTKLREALGTRLLKRFVFDMVGLVSRTFYV